MPENIRGEVPVKICGKDLSIAPTYRAIEAIELRLGCGIPELLGRAINGEARIRDYAVIVHEGLKGAGHGGANGKGELFSLDEVGEDVLGNFTDYSRWVGEFLGNALGGRSPKGKRA